MNQHCFLFLEMRIIHTVTCIFYRQMFGGMDLHALVPKINMVHFFPVLQAGMHIMKNGYRIICLLFLN